MQLCAYYSDGHSIVKCVTFGESLPLPGQTGKRGTVFVFLSMQSFVRPFICEQTWAQYFENKQTDFDANWLWWSTGQEHIIINFEIRGVKNSSLF